MSQAVEFGTYQGEAPKYRGMTTQSFYLTMRDGVKLAVDVVLPKGLASDARLPALLSQTRYWRAMELRAPFSWFLDAASLTPDFADFNPFFSNRGYALVFVDVRGTGASFGAWPYPWPDDSIQDAAEVVDWIVSQPWSNGKVGGHGISYVGTTAEMLLVADHPAVRAVIPMFNHPDAYVDIAFPGGVLNERFIKLWGHFDRTLDRNQVPPEFGAMGRLMLKGVKPVDGDKDGALLQAAVRDHAANGDVFQTAQAVTFRDELHDEAGIRVDDLTLHRHKETVQQSATVTCGWGSWLDAGTADAVLRRFLTFDNAQRAVIGAWEHGGRYHASPYQTPGTPVNPSLPGQWAEMLRFFDAHLKDVDNGAGSEKVLHYYTLGEEVWKKTHVWPPQGTAMERWYFQARGGLAQTEPDDASGADAYTVDFGASSGQYNRWWEMGAITGDTVMYPDRDQAAVYLLTYTSPPLETDVEIAGYPVVTLYVTSTETDGVFYVYLEDVDESGQVTYITEGQLRAIHRKVSDEAPPYKLQVPYHSFKQEDAEPLAPGEIAELAFGLHPTSALVKQGHRLRVSVAGHDEGTFVRVPAQGTPAISVARNQVHASCIDLPVVSAR